MSPDRFIIDTNVLIAALITRDRTSPTARILDKMLNGTLVFLISPDLLAEYRHVLLRPRLRAAHKLSEAQIDTLLTEIVANAIWCEPQDNPAEIAPDPGDRHLWLLLASNKSAALVTGDRLLLDNPRPGSSVLDPAACLMLL